MYKAVRARRMWIHVKMVHNGIEQGMIPTLCEVWFIMSHCLGMEYEEIGKSFEEWNESWPLVSVSAAVCRASLTQI